MKRNWGLRALKVALFVGVGCAVFGFIVMGLWNLLMPVIFGWHTINFWQAVGLLILSKVLFGGFRGPGFWWRGRMRERWAAMTPEERERFREGMRRRCGAPEPSTQGQG
jgi:hypothetical protein